MSPELLLELDVQPWQPALYPRPEPGRALNVPALVAGSMLGSSQAPAAGTATGEAARIYSVE